MFSALAFTGAICTSVAASKVKVPVFGPGEPLNPEDGAKFVDISGTFTQDPNVEFSTLSVPGDGNCFFWSLLVALEVHKALKAGSGSVEIAKTISHNRVIEAREQFKVLGRALVDWYQVNVGVSKYVRLTPDGMRAIERLFQAKGIENDFSKQKAVVELFLGHLCQAYNELSLSHRIAERKEHYEQMRKILGSGDHVDFFKKIYPSERIFLPDNIPGFEKIPYEKVKWTGLAHQKIKASESIEIDGMDLRIDKFVFDGFTFRTLMVSGPQVNDIKLDRVSFEKITVDTIQWYHVNAIFADRTYFPTDLVDLCSGLEMCSGTDVHLMVKGDSGHWRFYTEMHANRPFVCIQIKGNHFEPLVKVQSNAKTSSQHQNGAHGGGDSELAQGAKDAINEQKGIVASLLDN